MVDEEERDLTQLLHQAADGQSDAKEQLYEVIYDDLRDAARRVIRRNVRGDFQTTALVNDVLSRVTYDNVSNGPPATVLLDYAFSDGNTAKTHLVLMLKIIFNSSGNLRSCSNRYGASRR